VHVTYPVGAGPIINSVGIARHSSGDPTIAITTYLNPPNWVAAYNASSGTDSPSPMWTLSPSTSFSPSTIYFVDCARHQDDSGDKTSAVDTFSLLSEDNEYTGCTIQGSASNAGAGAAPRWNWTAPSCAAFSAQDQWRYIDASDDGSTLCAQLFEEGGVRYPVTHAFDAQTGKHLWARKLDASAGGYGVEVSDDGRWVVQGIDDSVKSDQSQRHRAFDNRRVRAKPSRDLLEYSANYFWGRGLRCWRRIVERDGVEVGRVQLVVRSALDAATLSWRRSRLASVRSDHHDVH